MKLLRIYEIPCFEVKNEGALSEKTTCVISFFPTEVDCVPSQIIDDTDECRIIWTKHGHPVYAFSERVCVCASVFV